MSTWQSVIFAAAAFTLTYLFCVRPMMRGRGKGEDSEIADLREELRALRAHDSSRRQPPEE